MILLDSYGFDFENTLTQSEERELPTSGHKSVMEGLTMVSDSVYWPFIYIYMKELPISKKESGCILSFILGSSF